MANKQITRADILPPAQYAAERKTRRQAMVARKRNRRVEVGPFATFYFECYDTMFQQIHEMLHIEKGGEDQIADELHAYNPLIPQGSELVATVMFEIDDPVKRERELSRLGGIEECFALEIGGTSIPARPETDVERTTPDGKTSSVHFVHFDLTPEQVAVVKTPNARVLVSITHSNYGHLAVIPETVRAELAGDLD